MKISGDKLKARAQAAGASVEDLASAVQRVGLKGPAAVSAVRNWMGGRDHPRCRAEDVARLAQALGCAPKDLVVFQSQVRWHRGSNKKAKLVVDVVRGKPVDVAMNLLTFSNKRAAINVKKCLAAAIADAEQFDADVGSLVVCESRVDGATHIKRFQPKDRGRAHQILKRQSHITIGVEER